MSKIKIISKREFIVTVKRRGYIIATFGIPLFFLVIGLIALIPNWLSLQKTLESKKMGVVDYAGVLRLELAGKLAEEFKGNRADFYSYLMGENQDREKFIGRIELRAYSSKEEALGALEKGEVDGVYLIPKNYLEKGEVELYQKSKSPIGRLGGFELFLRRLLVASLSYKRVDAALQKRLQKPMHTVEFVRDREGEYRKTHFLKDLSKVVVPYFFAFLLMFSILTTSAYLIQGMSEEKENRIMEILLSSVSSQELFIGKIIGLGGAGLLQFFVWMLICFWPITFLLPFIPLSWKVFVGGIVYFLLGIALLGSLSTGFGALGRRFHESHQFAMFWSMVCIIPIFFFSVILDAPNGFLARFFSYLPVTSPVCMMMRLSTERVDWLDIPISILLLVLATWLSIKVCSRLFRVGVLLYGRKPSWKEILYWLRRDL